MSAGKRVVAAIIVDSARPKLEPTDAGKTTAATPATDASPAASGKDALRRQVRATMGYEAQASLLQPAGKPEPDPAPAKPAAKPTTTGFSATIRGIFKELDKNGDGFVSRPEANAALSDPAYKGDDAAAIAALHKYLDLLEELSNDEFLDENDGLTMADLAAYEKNALKDKLKGNLQYVEGTRSVGQERIAGANRELFPNGLPSLRALSQGAIGDCYFLAALGSYIARDPAALTRIIKETRKGKTVASYTVSFPGNLGSATVSPPTDGEIARYSSAGSDGLWLVVMEKAYAVARSRVKTPDVQEEVGEGGQLSTGISAFTTKGTDMDVLSLTRQSATQQKLDSAFGRGKGKDAGKKRLVTAAVMSSNKYGLPKGHAYSVIGWDGTSLTVRNPWGLLKAPAKDADRVEGVPGQDPYATGVFLMTLATFDDVFSEIAYEE